MTVILYHIYKAIKNSVARIPIRMMSDVIGMMLTIYIKVRIVSTIAIT